VLYTHAIAAVIALALGGYTGWTSRGWKSDADAAKIQQAAWDANRKADRAFVETAARVDAADAARRLAADSARARDRDAVERVRIAAALAGRRDPPAAACEPVERQFAECRSLLSEGASVVAEGADSVRELGRKHAGAVESH
jgi:hypothetical protein